MMFCRQTLRTFIYSSEIFPWIIIITIVFLFLVIPDIALLLTLHFVLNYIWLWRTCSNWVCNLFEFRRSLQPRLPLPLHQPLAQDPSSVPSRSVELLILPVSLLLLQPVHFWHSNLHCRQQRVGVPEVWSLRRQTWPGGEVTTWFSYFGVSSW
jgi:hypothetical protein